MKRSRINPISAKQKEKNRIWKGVTDARCCKLNFVCEYCGKDGQRQTLDRWDYLDGHHIIKRRFNDNTSGNCYICHRLCHQEIELKHIQVAQGDYETRKLFL